MINLLNAEFFKLKKSKSFKIVAILTVGFSMVTYLLYAVLQRDLAGSPDTMTAAIRDAISNMDILYILQEMFAKSNVTLFVSIFICLFAIGDYSSGAVKNFVGKGLRREELYLSRFLVTEFGVVILYLLTALAVLAGGVVYFGTEQLSGAFWGDFFTYFSMQILYVTSYTAMILLVCELTRNMAAGILISILGVLLFSPVIFQGIDLILNSLHVPFETSKFWLITQIGSCPVSDIPASFIVRSGIVAGVWLIVTLVAGMLYHAWQDVK